MKTLRTTLGIILVLVITFAGINISQNIGKRIKVDVTEKKLYSLTDGSKAILKKLGQPITAKLYFAKTASLKAPDQIRFFSNYYEYVRALLEEYAHQSNGMVRLEIIDPRPYSKDEEDAVRYGLQRFNLPAEEGFFFGLVVQTEFGAEKSIPFFAPERQRFVEYDISYLIDTAITRQKKVIGVMSSLDVMGDDVTDYMRQMMRYQGQTVKEPWTLVAHLRQQYEVKTVATDVNDINDVDLLFVIHPKSLPEKTQFAIDQYVLEGGRAIVCVDPHAYVADRPAQPNMMQQMQAPPVQNSNLSVLLKAWGLEMPDNTFAGDETLALQTNAGGRPESMIAFLGLQKDNGCFNEDSAITSELNLMRMPFVGKLTVLDPNMPNLTHTPLLQTTEKGNTWKVSSPYELAMIDAQRIRMKFMPGTKPVNMAYMVSGRFTTAFPDGIDIDTSLPDPNDPNETFTSTERITGLTQATQDCAVVVISDVDFISDQLAYQKTFFGSMSPVGDNSALVLNSIEGLFGSNELISIRSRGNYTHPFELVNKIEEEAEAETKDEVEVLKAVISQYNQDLQQLLSKGQDGQEAVIGSDILAQRRNLETKIVEAKRNLNDVKLKRRERIEALGNQLRQWNMLAAPAVILCFAIIIGIRRSARNRHYITQTHKA
ncbi:MAG: GldG family protein [Planctomycetes bacterium]|nr:GldG family protein [Planctomycetota bacterium]